MARPRKKQPGQVFEAIESFTVEIDGVKHIVRADTTRVREGHPLLNGREHLFRPLTVQYDIEAATDAPGEARK